MSNASDRPATQQDILDLRKEIGSVDTRVDGLTTRVVELTTRVEGLTTRVDGLTTRVEGLTTRVEGLTTRVEKLETHMDELHDQLIERMRDMQTELLRAFHGWARSTEVKLRAIPPMEERMSLLEERVSAIERGDPPPSLSI